MVLLAVAAFLSSMVKQSNINHELIPYEMGPLHGLLQRTARSERLVIWVSDLIRSVCFNTKSWEERN